MCFARSHTKKHLPSLLPYLASSTLSFREIHNLAQIPRNCSRPGTRNSFSYGMKATLSSLLFRLKVATKLLLYIQPRRQNNETKAHEKASTRMLPKLYLRSLHSPMLAALSCLFVQLRNGEISFVFNDTTVSHNRCVLRNPLRDNVAMRSICRAFQLRNDSRTIRTLP